MAGTKGETRLIQTFMVKVYTKHPEDAVDELDIQDALMYEENPYRLIDADEVDISDVTPIEMYDAHGMVSWPGDQPGGFIPEGP